MPRRPTPNTYQHINCIPGLWAMIDFIELTLRPLGVLSGQDRILKTNTLILFAHTKVDPGRLRRTLYPDYGNPKLKEGEFAELVKLIVRKGDLASIPLEVIRGLDWSLLVENFSPEDMQKGVTKALLAAARKQRKVKQPKRKTVKKLSA